MFEFAYVMGGGDPHIETFVVKASAVIPQGALVNIETGEADLAVSNDVALAGVALESVDNTVDGHTIRVVINPNAVYSVVDANVRRAGAQLDIATGALGVTTDSNHDLVVVKDSTATERTLVMIVAGEHYLI